MNWRRGQPTDDTEQALCLIRSFVQRKKFDPQDVAGEFVAWLDSRPRDVGSTTRRTLSAIRSGTPWNRAGLEDWLSHPDSAANGALMRNGVMPGILLGSDLNQLFRATIQHTIITHGHPLAVLTCAIHSWIIADELTGRGEGPTADSDAWLDRFYSHWTAYVSQEKDKPVREYLDAAKNSFQAADDEVSEAIWNPFEFNPFKLDYTGRSGGCLLTLQIGVWAFLWSKMEQPFEVPMGFPPEVFARRGPWTIAWPAMLGFDSDTYAAVAAPMIAAAHKVVPDTMMEGLEALPDFDKLA
jgi:ADP-ribosylglycohydrolase